MNDENLIPFNKRPVAEVREIQRKGGIASGVARREKRKTIDILEIFLKSKVKRGNKKITREAAYFISIFNRAIKTGNIDLLELIAKLRGEMVTKVDAEISANMPTVLTDEVTDDFIDTSATMSDSQKALSGIVSPQLADEVASLAETFDENEKIMRERLKKAREKRMENIRIRKEMIARGETPPPKPEKKRKRQVMHKKSRLKKND